MRSYLTGVSVALISAALLSGPLPVSAKPAESQHNFFDSEFDPFASTLKAEGERALTAAADARARAVHDGSAALAEPERDAAQQLQELRATLSERKARLGMIGEDAAERLDSWTDAISTLHGSASGALERFRDRLETPSASDKPTQIPV